MTDAVGAKEIWFQFYKLSVSVEVLSHPLRQCFPTGGTVREDISRGIKTCDIKT